MNGENAPFAVFEAKDRSSRPVSPQDAGLTVSPVDRAGHDLGRHQQDSAGRPRAEILLGHKQAEDESGAGRHHIEGNGAMGSQSCLQPAGPGGQAVPGVMLAVRIRSRSAAVAPA
jgi:hypothetical protein